MGMNRRWSWMHALLTMAGIAVITGCGASAHRDIDLNKGEVDVPNPELEAIANQLFDDPWFTGAEQESTWRYTVNEGDKLEVTFFTHPEQNRFVTVRPDGRFSMPYIGEIAAAGRTAEELSEELQERYAEVLVSPRVDVLIHEMGARFYVMGEVRSGGEFIYGRPLTLSQALARAGGYTDAARLNNLVLLRRSPDGRGFAAILDFRAMMASPGNRGDIRLRPYDIVWVPRDNISRWDNVTRKLFGSVTQGEDIILRGWGLANFEDVYQKGARTP